jgi:hypothetical protein
MLSSTPTIHESALTIIPSVVKATTIEDTSSIISYLLQSLTVGKRSEKECHIMGRKKSDGWLWVVSGASCEPNDLSRVGGGWSF